MAQYAAQVTADSGGSVVACLSEGMRKQVTRNRSAVSTLMRVAIFCARQGIGLRGHRESFQCNDDERNAAEPDNNECHSQVNRGNFIEVIELLKVESDRICQALA